MRHRLAGLFRTDAVRAHHLIILVLNDVAVPDKETRLGKLHLEASDLARIGDDRVRDKRQGRRERRKSSPEKELPVRVSFVTFVAPPPGWLEV